MIGVTFHALGPEHHPQRKHEIFEHRTLLDMQLQIGGRVGLFAARFRKPIHLDAAAPECIVHADAVFVGSHAIRFHRMGPGEGRRSEQAAAETRAFFIRKIHQPDGDWAGGRETHR